MNRKFQLIISLLLAINDQLVECTSTDVSSENLLDNLAKKADSILKTFSLDENSEENELHPLDYFLLDIIPTFLGQKANNANGTESKFKEYLLSDNSNDDASHLDVPEMIARSGFEYEQYDALADDGYITIMTRIVNPLADKSKLRYPPVILEHGGTIDPTAYMIASSIQHHPEKWPRTPMDGPITSWNRSLAFYLANGGFDVWLAETRGSNANNKRKKLDQGVKSALSGENRVKNMTTFETIYEIVNSVDYWSFSQDDIIAHEIKSHIDTVLEITGADQVNLFTFSLSTPTSLAFLSIRPDYSEKINGYISMAPIISGEGVNDLIRFVLQELCPLVPETMGTMLITDVVLSQPMRDFLLKVSENKHLRYSIVKLWLTILLGPSAKWKTLLDLNVLGHIMRQLSFKEAKHLCQQTKANKLQKYDYGPIKNKILYNSTEPPVYDLKNIHLKEWIIVAAENDALSTPQVLDHLLTLVEPKPIATLIAPGYNHLDLIAALDNDKYVNYPIAAYLESKCHIPGEGQQARSLDLSSLMPLIPKKPKEDKPKEANVTVIVENPLDPGKIFEGFFNNFNNLIKGFGGLGQLFKTFSSSD